MLVIVLLGILFSFAAPNFDGLTPKYRLRTAARRLAADIESHRLAAVSRGTWLGVLYTMNGDETYYQLIPPPPRDYPNQPVADRAPFAPERLPTGVMIQSVQLRGSPDLVDTGTILVRFSPTGTTGSHSVTLIGSSGVSWTVRLNTITGVVDFRRNEEEGFDDFEG